MPDIYFHDIFHSFFGKMSERPRLREIGSRSKISSSLAGRKEMFAYFSAPFFWFCVLFVFEAGVRKCMKKHILMGCNLRRRRRRRIGRRILVSLIAFRYTSGFEWHPANNLCGFFVHFMH